MTISWRQIAALALLGCVGCSERAGPASSCPCGQRTLRLAATTSVDNTGLLKRLLDPFGKRTGIKTHVLAVGTGKALKLAERGDADLVLVHDRQAELSFIARGFGLRRVPVMHNEFVIIGPPGDPAKIKGLGAAQALTRIAAGKAPFISRGDDSGTHKAERRLWRRAGVEPPRAGAQAWYLESGQGQRLTVNMAHEKRAYCVTDRATFLDAREAISLHLLVEGDKMLHNPYSAIAVNPARHPHAKLTEAMALIGWLTSAEGQRLIGSFERKQAVLFFPDAIPGAIPGAIPRAAKGPAVR